MSTEGMRDEVAPHNPWWTTGLPPKSMEGFRRSDYKYHHNLLVESRKKLLVLSGRRGIGKTNTVRRLIHDLLQEDDVEPQDVLYLPLDNPIYQRARDDVITDAVEWYRQRVRDERDGHHFLFLDDVHSVGEDRWREQVAELLEDDDAHVVVTTVHGRLEDIEDEFGEEVPPPHMLPRKFFDYTVAETPEEIDTDTLKNRSREARHSILQALDAAEPEPVVDAYEAVAETLEGIDLAGVLEEYETRDLDTETPADRNPSDQLELTIYKEMPRVRGFRDVVGAHSLCKHIAETPTGYVSYSELESELDIESRQLKRYVDALSDLYLVNPVYPFNYDVRRNFRLYLQNPSYAYTFSATEERVSDDKVSETVALDHLKRLSFYFHAQELPYSISTGGKAGKGTDAYNFRRDIDFVFNYYPEIAADPSPQNGIPDLSDAGAEISVPTGSGGGTIRASSVPVNVSEGSGDAEAMESVLETVNEHDSSVRFPVGILLTDDADVGDVRVHDRVVEIPRGLFALTC